LLGIIIEISGFIVGNGFGKLLIFLSIIIFGIFVFIEPAL
jgi:hypothetical protein